MFINDLKSLTGIPLGTLEKLISVENAQICHQIFEQQIEYDNIPEIDIGIGKLILNIADDKISYKFIPSKELENMVIETIKYKKSPLETLAEENLSEKIMRTYKELL